MKRKVIVELIKKYILDKPGRPFAEVKAYAINIEATDQEIKEAILQAAESFSQNINKSSFKRSNMREKFIFINDCIKKLEPIQKPLIITTSALVLVLLSFTAVGIISSSNSNKQVKSSFTTALPTGKVTSNKNVTSFSLTPRTIYASQRTIDVKKAFSYPASPISLRFSGVPKREVFGFFPYWIVDVADKINLDGYTSISLFGIEVDGKGNIVTTNEDKQDSGWAMWNNKNLNTVIAQAKKKRIKVYLTIKSFNNKNIEELVASDEAQRRMIANTINLINMKSLDGVNLDFEYVGKASPETIFGFTRLVANMNSELKRQYPKSVLTVDTYIRSAAALEFFDVQLLQDYVDAFVIMGYDVHTPSGSAGPVAPMEGGNGIMGHIQSYLERVKPEKIILAVPYYGYDWQVDTGQNTQEETSKSVNTKTLSYAEIAGTSKQYNILWDDVSQTPFYRYSENGANREVHFENIRSLGLKYDFIKRKNLKGVGIWAIGYDGLNQELQQLLIDKFTN